MGLKEDLTIVFEDLTGKTAAVKAGEVAEAILEHNSSRVSLFRNGIINPDGEIAQRGASGSAIFTAATTPANNNDSYLIDRNNLLSDGNDIVDVSQSTDAPEGSRSSVKYIVVTANKKFVPFFQIFENKNSLPFDNKSVSISFQAKTTAAKVIRNLRAAVVAWDGAADAVTSDIISAWAAEGTNPTLVANWTFENVAINIPISTTWTTYKIENISIDTPGMTNLAMIVWVDDADAVVGDELFIAQNNFNEGEIALDFMPRNFVIELTLCQRFYSKSYNLSVRPGTTTSIGAFTVITVLSSTAQYQLQQEFKVSMRVTPTIICYSSSTGTANRIRNYSNNTDYTVAAQTWVGSEYTGYPTTTVATPSANLVGFHWMADAEL